MIDCLRRLRDALAVELRHPGADHGVATYSRVRARLVQLDVVETFGPGQFQACFPSAPAEDDEPAWTSQILADLMRQLQGYIDAIASR